MKTQLHVIGVHSQELTISQKTLLDQCSLIAGGKRLLQLCVGIPVKTLPITPLDTALPTISIALKDGDVAILASGDPLFFGIGKRLIHAFGADVVQIHPALSSLQLALARFKLPWDDVKLVSLHGRTHGHIPGMLMENDKTFVLTDKTNSPGGIAAQMIEYLQCIGEKSLLNNYTILVAENLGSADEKLFTGSLHEAAARSFSDLNVMCLVRPKSELKPTFGLLEEEIQHSRGLITKDEVRAVTLHRLRLPPEGVFWDVGAGSGSISIEAARMNPKLTIYAIERKDEELENIRKNICRYACYNIIPVAGNAQDVLHTLPNPDRVFIGGNGGQLESIVKEAAERLPEGGWLVANGVIEKTITQAPQLMEAHGFTVSQSKIHISRTDATGEVVDFNPITIIAGGKFV